MAVSNNSNHKCCPVCGSANNKILLGYEKDHLSKCKKCGFVFSVQIPSTLDLTNHYSGYGRKDYLSPLTINRYNELLDYFEHYRKFNRILDVGAGIGYFLEEAKKRGWEVYGTEFTDEAILICENKGISMKKGQLYEGMFPAGFFDIITSFEVIEHLVYPKVDIQIIHNLLRKNGALYLTTPNFNSFLRRYLGGKWNVISYPEHLSYFTANSISFLVCNQGFKKIWVKTHGLSLTRLKTSQKKNNEKYISPESTDEKLRISLEQNRYKKLIKLTANAVLNTFRLGDSLKCMFVKY